MTEKQQWYPAGPPMLPGESAESYTNRLTGALGRDVRPYDHSRNRQCSIGYHMECSDREHSGQCECPCHKERSWARERVLTWNAAYPVGTLVRFPASAMEPDERTTSTAYVDEDGWPVVDVHTFPHPVWLSWLAPLDPES